jgi:hypothetical protein
MPPITVPPLVSTSIPEQTFPVYCTDEDILVRASGDYINLVPNWQCMAIGTDGVFAPGAPWTLTSPTVNFGTNGVKPCHVIALKGPRTQYPGSGDMLAIDSVSTDGFGITLRRPHKDLYVGQQPCPPAGITGVSFAILTFDPQSEEASFAIKRSYAIAEDMPYRSSAWIYDLRDLRILAVLKVLYDRYTSELRSDKGDWLRKISLIKTQLDEVAGRVEVRWGPYGNSQEPTTIFSTRLSR